jgi:hypothetical protein
MQALVESRESKAFPDSKVRLAQPVHKVTVARKEKKAIGAIKVLLALMVRRDLKENAAHREKLALRSPMICSPLNSLPRLSAPEENRGRKVIPELKAIKATPEKPALPVHRER